jgi:hypothetical protein
MVYNNMLNLVTPTAPFCGVLTNNNCHAWKTKGLFLKAVILYFASCKGHPLDSSLFSVSSCKIDVCNKNG